MDLTQIVCVRKMFLQKNGIPKLKTIINNNIELLVLKMQDAKGMANRVDTDQTAPLGAV